LVDQNTAYKYLNNITNYAKVSQVTYDLLLYNMALATLSTGSNSK